MRLSNFLYQCILVVFNVQTGYVIAAYGVWRNPIFESKTIELPHILSKSKYLNVV